MSRGAHTACAHGAFLILCCRVLYSISDSVYKALWLDAVYCFRCVQKKWKRKTNVEILFPVVLVVISSELCRVTLTFLVWMGRVCHTRSSDSCLLTIRYITYYIRAHMHNEPRSPPNRVYLLNGDDIKKEKKSACIKHKQDYSAGLIRLTFYDPNTWKVQNDAVSGFKMLAVILVSYLNIYFFYTHLLCLSCLSTI